MINSVTENKINIQSTILSWPPRTSENTSRSLKLGRILRVAPNPCRGVHAIEIRSDRRVYIFVLRDGFECTIFLGFEYRKSHFQSPVHEELIGTINLEDIGTGRDLYTALLGSLLPTATHLFIHFGLLSKWFNQYKA